MAIGFLGIILRLIDSEGDAPDVNTELIQDCTLSTIKYLKFRVKYKVKKGYVFIDTHHFFIKIIILFLKNV